MNRTAMKAGSTLLLRNSESGETVRLEIISEALGRGSSCIVYEAKALGQKLACKYRLKELYPKDIHGIYRDSSNELIINEDSYDKYNAAKDRFERSLDLLWDFAYSDETGNYTVCPLGKFEGVSDSKCPALYLITQWMPSDYISSVSLCSRSDISNIETAVKICLKTTYAAMQFHKMGYINLDIKPENILYSPRTDTISFFDTDTIFHKDIPPSEPISFSQGAAPEIINGFASLYSEKIDVFAIGAMLHRFITGENYAAGQYSLDIPERRNAICKCRSLKYASPEVSDMIVHILECCCKGNPTKRISTEELASMLEQLVLLLSPESTEKSSCNNDEINIFLNNTNKLYKTNKMIRRIYVTAFCLFTGVLLITAFFGKAFSVHSIVVSIVCIFMMLLLRSMIFKR
jgi:serine/threonine protein kinase